MGGPFPSPGNLPDPGIKPRSPALQVDSLPSEPSGKPPKVIYPSNSVIGISGPLKSSTWEKGWETQLWDPHLLVLPPWLTPKNEPISAPPWLIFPIVQILLAWGLASGALCPQFYFAPAISICALLPFLLCLLTSVPLPFSTCGGVWVFILIWSLNKFMHYLNSMWFASSTLLVAMGNFNVTWHS